MLNGTEFNGATPYDRRVFVLKQERHADDLHAEMALSGVNALVFDMEAPTVKTHHLGDVRPGDVNVENAHGVTLLSKRESEAR